MRFHPFHFRLHFLRTLLPQLALLFQSPEDDLVDAGVDGGALAGGGEAAEREFAGEHFVDDDAEAVDVGAVIDVAGIFVLFGGHVGGAAERTAGHGESEIAVRVADEASDAEIGDFHATAGIEQDVFRFDIAVPDALGVGGLERVADRRDEGERLLRGEPAGPHRLAEVHAIDVFHEQVEVSAALAVLENGDDVRVVEFAEGACFAGETFGEGGIAAEFGREDFQGDGAIERRLARLIDEAHAALSDEPDDFPLRKCGCDFLQRRGGAAGGRRFLGIAEEAGRTKPARRVGGDGCVASGAGFRIHTGS